jgi:hypothetical protein
MRKFELMKWVGLGNSAEPTEFVLRGTLMDIVNYAKENGLSFRELPGHLIGGYYTKPIDNYTAEAFEVVPVGGVA